MIRPHSLFLALALGFGLAVLVANPPFQAPDEWEHFFRAFQLSEGTIVGQKQGQDAGGTLPSVLGFAGDPMYLAFHPEKKMTRAVWLEMLHPIFFQWRGAPRGFFFFPHIVLYSPGGYVPQTLGILLGKLLWVGPLGLLYLARLAGFVACVGLGYAALRCAPFYRWSLMLILLAPMSLYLMGSVAQDGILFTATFLLVALLVRLATDSNHRPGWQEQAVIIALAAVLSLTKFVYLPLAAVAPCLVLPRLSSSRAKAALGTAYAGFCLLPLWAWSRVIASLYTPGRTDILTDPVAQIHHVVTEPLTFLSLVARSLVAQGSDVFHQAVGVLGWLDAPLPRWFYSAYGFGVLGCLLLESTDAARLRWKERLLFLGAVMTTVVLTYTAIYADWNSPGSTTMIDGIAGRYFLPLAPMIVVSFPSTGHIRTPAWAPSLLGIVLGTTSAAVCLWVVISRYYI